MGGWVGGRRQEKDHFNSAMRKTWCGVCQCVGKGPGGSKDKISHLEGKDVSVACFGSFLGLCLAPRSAYTHKQHRGGGRLRRCFASLFCIVCRLT